MPVVGTSMSVSASIFEGSKRHPFSSIRRPHQRASGANRRHFPGCSLKLILIHSWSNISIELISSWIYLHWSKIPSNHWRSTGHNGSGTFEVSEDWRWATGFFELCSTLVGANKWWSVSKEHYCESYEVAGASNRAKCQSWKNIWDQKDELTFFQEPALNRGTGL